MPLILGAQSAVAGGDVVTNSCRFNSADSPTLTKTQVAGSRTKATFSVWVKRGDLSEDTLYTQFANGTNFTRFRFSSDTINCNDRTSGVENYYFTTNAVYRDPGAWYHVVVAIDTTQVTDTDRLNCWVNGVLQTFASQSYPTKDANMNFNQTGDTTQVGANELPADYFDGYLAEVVWIDGTQYAASDFGEFDSDSPTIWKPKKISGLTFGNNGFYLDFEDSANLGNDANGGTDLTETNLDATDQATDTPDNNFSTANPLNNPNAGMSWSNGNTTVTNSGQWRGVTSSLGMRSGKWYTEFKITGTDAQSGGVFGIGKAGVSTSTYYMESANNGYASKYAYGYERWMANSSKTNNNSSTSGYGTVMAENDIGMVAFDADNGTVWTGVNGTWDGSATEGEIEAGTTTNAMFSGIVMDDAFFFTWSIEGSAVTPYINCNFGNPPYANSSDEPDEDGYGAFEYAPPSGYFALCTKNLAEYG